MIAPEPDFTHLAALTDRHGTFEHAEGATPRREHGYTTDDMARVLVVTAREPHPSATVLDLARKALRFAVDAQGVDGTSRNRMRASGRWRGRRSVEDCWGRSLWGFGTAAACSPDDWVRQVALAHFERGAAQRSPWRRAMAFATLGAAEVVAAHPEHVAARALLVDGAAAVGPLGAHPVWPWPEPRLTYANAVIPDALVAAGAALGRDRLVDDGLYLLGWLLDEESRDGRLSVTPVGGRAPGDRRPAFDQQPIEVAALADACARAAELTGEPRWTRGVADAVAWFLGVNDATTVMWDETTGGCFDGLEADGCNRNQGAESTLALISTLQHARQLAPAAA